MKLTEYIPLAIRTEKPLQPLDRLVHSCMGLITEIGEVTSELKRMAIYEKPLDDDRKKHILEEIGDVLWYIAIGVDALQTPLHWLENAPTMQNRPLGSSGFYEATALMFGKHCGKLCDGVAVIYIKQQIPKPSFGSVQSYIMILQGLRVLAEHCGSTLEQAMDDNIAKLRIRFPEQYSNEAAEGRADKAGANARVS